MYSSCERTYSSNSLHAFSKMVTNSNSGGMIFVTLSKNLPGLVSLLLLQTLSLLPNEQGARPPPLLQGGAGGGQWRGGS